jgi:cyanate permease
VAEATAPMLVGYLRDVRGTYDAGFATLVAAAIMGAVAIATLPTRVMPEAAQPASANL